MLKVAKKSLKPILRLRSKSGGPDARTWLVAFSAASTVVLAAVLAFGETTLRSLLDRWLSQCIVVIDIERPRNDALIVRISTFGDLPPSLPFTFSANRGVIDRVSMLNQVEQRSLGEGINLLVHPLANQRCPGDLCANQTGAAEKLTVRLKPIGSNYSYQFRILTSDEASTELINVYVRPLQGEIITCRVEKASITNYLARQPPAHQAAYLFLLVFFCVALIGLTKRITGENK